MPRESGASSNRRRLLDYPLSRVMTASWRPPANTAESALFRFRKFRGGFAGDLPECVGKRRYAGVA
jgi:hypothetical protein